MYIMLNNIFTSMQNLDSHKKPEGGGIGGGCSAPPPPRKKMNMVLRVYILGNMHLVTIYIYMERRLRRRTVTVMENVVKHKSSRYSGRIDFNKCPEILFSELKKGLVGTLFENICQFLSQKHAYKFRSKKLQKPRNRKSQRAKSMSSTYLQYVLH